MKEMGSCPGILSLLSPVQGCRPDGTVFFWNRASEELYGYPASEALGRNLADLIVPEEGREQFLKALERGKAVRDFGEFFPAGKLIFRDRAGKPVKLYSVHLAARVNGEVLLFFLVLDSSGRKLEAAYRRAEERLRERVAGRTRKLRSANIRLRREAEAREVIERDLRESEGRFRSVFDNAQDPIFIESREGEILDVNRAGCRLLGYTREELLSLKVLELVPAELRSPFEPRVRPETVRPGIYIETEYIRKDGTRVPVEISDTVVTLAGEERVVSVVRDITGRKREEDERRQIEEQLRQAQKMETAAALAGGMAHDFGNLLNAIRGHVELIKEQLREEDPLRREIRELDRTVVRAGSLIRKLLTVGRRNGAGSGRADSNDVLEDMVPMLRRVCGKRVRLDLDLKPAVGEVAVGREEMEQVIVNLVLNSREAIAGRGKISVFLRSVELGRSPVARMIGKKPGLYAVLTVSDTGCGMSEVERSRIFEPFFTSKDNELNSGLGLAVVYGIVERGGGFIQVESEPGRGTVFTIYLPLAGTSDAPAGRRRVLLVDDDRGFRKLAVELLKQLGYEAAAVPDGRLAEELFLLEKEAGRPFEAVILDLVVPGDRSGADTFYRLQEIDPEVKAVLCSGYTADPLMTDARGYGFSAALPKPFSIEKLGAVLREIGVPPPEAS